MNTLGPDGHRARLKARFLGTGGAGVADYELLELALTYAIPRRDVKPLAKLLLAKFGNLGGVLTAPPEELLRVEGLGPGSVAFIQVVQQLALRVRREGMKGQPLLADRLSLLDYLYTRFAGVGQEEVVVLFLNAELRLMAEETLFVGTLTSVAASPRDVLAKALAKEAAGIILAHNHPHGAPNPSPEDKDFTVRLMQAAAALGVVFHDHLIIGAEEHFSFRAQGLM